MARVLAQRAVYAGAAKVRGRLYDLGRYPGMLEPRTEDDWVHGDLYDLGEGTTTLAVMDAYELAESPLPATFERQVGEAVRGDGMRVAAWIYWYRGEVPDSQQIVSGRYDKDCADGASEI
jgi:gamma-glutamylcyclotransferase (GGCT)/AIG2-like uncharacterized protein YtfP